MAPKKKAKSENGAKVTDSGEDGGACLFSPLYFLRTFRCPAM